MSWDLMNTDHVEFDEIPGILGNTHRKISYKDAIKEAISQVMEKDSTVFIMGEGVDHYNWIFDTTTGLVEKFGRDRIFDMPIAESSITGIAIGAALAGLKPIVVHMRMDFLMLAMDQIVNHASKWKYMFGGKAHVPMVIRTLIGRGWGSGAQHSQALHAFFYHTPGIKVVMPSSPYDVKGLFISSTQDGNPIVFIEPRFIYGQKGYVPEEMYSIPLGKGVLRKKGKDLTIVAISSMNSEALSAAVELEKEGKSIEIIDPRTIKPLDEDLIFDSVKKTGRAVIADVGWITGGVASDISARISENLFKFLKAPVLRVALQNSPTPASSVLEKAFYPDRNKLIEAAKRSLNYS